MDQPFYGDPELARRGRAPVALWLLAVMIAVVLGTAAILAAITTDTRDVAARHATVVPARLL